jgi:hypothetical protein
MFVYNKAAKPISVRLPECAYQSCQIETQDRIYFVFDLLGIYEGKLIVETYSRKNKRFEKIESTAELKLVCDESSLLDYYELPL